MKKLLAIWLLGVILAQGAVWAADESLTFGRFGKLAVYQPQGNPEAVVLFVSGDGGWNQGVVDMARQLNSLGALVVGIDIRAYLKAVSAGKQACAYPAADFESLSKYVQKQQRLVDYRVPILVGYSSGATLVYAVLAQAPGNTFAGAISLGFCPDLETGVPLCKGAGLTWQRQKSGFVLDPVKHLAKPWIALQGDVDQVCAAGQTRIFVDQVPNGRIVRLPEVGHGFSVYRNWLPQFKDAFRQIQGAAVQGNRPSPAAPAAVADLPLVEIPAGGQTSPRLAVFYSGDGGWADLDQAVSARLAAGGIPVVGVNSLRYFWQSRRPEEAAADLARILDHYAALWQKTKVVLIGYSFGADVLPFLASRLSKGAAAKIDLIVLIGPSQTAEFEFHLSDWVGGGSSTARPLIPEIARLPAVPLLCLYGQEESDSLCRTDLPGRVKSVALKGSHHFGGDFAAIAQAVAAALEP